MIFYSLFFRYTFFWCTFFRYSFFSDTLFSRFFFWDTLFSITHFSWSSFFLFTFFWYSLFQTHFPEPLFFWYSFSYYTFFNFFLFFLFLLYFSATLFYCRLFLLLSFFSATLGQVCYLLRCCIFIFRICLFIDQINQSRLESEPTDVKKEKKKVVYMISVLIRICVNELFIFSKEFLNFYFISTPSPKKTLPHRDTHINRSTRKHISTHMCIFKEPYPRWIGAMTPTKWWNPWVVANHTY